MVDSYSLFLELTNTGSFCLVEEKIRFGADPLQFIFGEGKITPATSHQLLILSISSEYHLPFRITEMLAFRFTMDKVGIYRFHLVIFVNVHN